MGDQDGVHAAGGSGRRDHPAQVADARAEHRVRDQADVAVEVDHRGGVPGATAWSPPRLAPWGRRPLQHRAPPREDRMDGSRSGIRALRGGQAEWVHDECAVWEPPIPAVEGDQLLEGVSPRRASGS